jgi:hypothetical protein
MPCKRKLNQPFMGMDFIWDIDSSVGVHRRDVNDPFDIQLVQLLIHLNLRFNPGAPAPGCSNKPQATGIMDNLTGFWIYFYQVEGKATVDGYLTPCKTGFYNDERLICRLNLWLSKKNKDIWQNLPNDPLCPPALKEQLNFKGQVIIGNSR